jgi:anti-sigma regulatory factor (Ser/Thr protein kinase)
MRRTADSLLILADAPNRAAGQFSLTAGEALQAATSAVQDYQRVQILSHLGTRIGDDAAADVVHLLTELVDNALTYSPPAEPVRLAAKLGDDGVTITITDAGLGVPPAELEALNKDLAHGAEATPDTARRMGLFVVSRLAERHGIHAQLARNPGGGMTATVLLPPAILPDLPQSATPAAGGSTTSVGTVESRTVETAEVAAHEESKRGARRSRAEKAQAKAAERAAEKVAASEARIAKAAETDEAKAAQPAPVEEPAAADDTVTGTPDRPSLESLLPRREPGANIPRTGADAFLPPETSGESGPLFAKRTPAAADTATDENTADTNDGADESAQPTRRVASVVPITALAARQRAQAEEARVADEKAAEEPVEEPVAEHPVVEPEAVEETVVEPVAEESEESEESVEAPARAYDPLSDPLSDDAFDQPEQADEASEQADEPAAEVAPEPEPEPQPAPAAVHQERRDVEVDADDPLGLGSSSRQREPVVDETATEVVEEPVEEPAAEEETAVEAPAAAMESDQSHNGAEPARSGGVSPIFKSIRSGWLAVEGEGEWKTNEVDRGWDIAEHAEEVAVVESTVTGLPRRAPGERLVPGSVTPPTAAKTRDPEAIRRRLQAHTAGVSRGRRAAQSSTQHTEAGPA